MEPLTMDSWASGNTFDVVTNPLEVRIEDIARIIRENHVEVQLIGEEDVEYLWV
jgi:hypothetical protein